MKKRLTAKHPTAIKLAELEAKAHELGLQLVFHDSQLCTVKDVAFPGKEFQVQDLEYGPGPEEFPSNFDYKLTYEES